MTTPPTDSRSDAVVPTATAPDTSTPCCSPAKQSTCCDATEKPGCCGAGSDPGGGCGCQ